MDPTPHQRLAAQLRALVETVPAHYGTLLAAPEFERGRAAIEALDAPGRIEAVAAALAPEEADWIADELARRWEIIAPAPLPRTEPGASLIAPPVLWHLTDDLELPLAIETTNFAAGWSAIWPDGATETAPGQARWTGQAEGRAHLDLAARVIGTPAGGKGGRTILVAMARIALVEARAVITPDRRTLTITATDGTPAAGLTIEAGGQTLTLDTNGQARFDTPLPEGAALRFAPEGG